MTALHADRAAAPPALLEVGFRPFFLAGAAWALVSIGLWLAALSGALVPGGELYGPIVWHAHEMVYGVGAGIAGGFLLTAVPSWTGQPKLLGWPLALLAGVWLLGRIVVTVPDGLGVAVVAALDLAFLTVIAVRTGWQIRASRNWRNLPMVAGPLVLLTGNVLVHAGAAGLVADGAGLGNRLGLVALVLMVTLIGGRIIPAFTRNWLVNTGRGAPLPAEPGRFDAVMLLATVAAFAAWLALPAEPATGVLAAIVAVGHLARLARWKGWRTGAEPLVWVLHLGYLWIPVGLGLITAATLVPAAVPEASALHALGTGAAGTMMLAMMTRATLGHTGRALTADRWTTAVYLLVTGAAALRVAAPLAPDVYTATVGLSGACWILAFAVYLAAYAPKLCGPRVDAECAAPR